MYQVLEASAVSCNRKVQRFLKARERGLSLSQDSDGFAEEVTQELHSETPCLSISNA